MIRRKHFSWTIFILCIVEAFLWFQCIGATSSAEAEEFLIRENKNLREPNLHKEEPQALNNNIQPNVEAKELQQSQTAWIMGTLSHLLIVGGTALLIKRLFFSNICAYDKPKTRNVTQEADAKKAFLNKYKGEETADVIVIGCGIVGSTMSVQLGKQGRNVLCLERDLSEPDRIVGELLQPKGVQALKEMGLEGCLEGIDSPECYGYCVVRNGENIRLPYPQVLKHEKTKGHGFHHGRFIQKLRDAAKNTPNVDLRQATVLKLLREDGKDGKVIGVEYRVNRDEVKRAYAPLTVVCDGCFSKFRRDFVETQPVAESSFVGVVLEDCKLPYPLHGHVFLVEPSPVLAYQIGTNETRVLVDIPNPMPSAGNGDLKKYLQEVTAPQLPEGSVRDSFLAALEKDRIRSMPNSKLHPHPFLLPGVIMLGDAYNMRHPLTGGGMTVAFSDVLIASEEINGVNIFNEADTKNAIKRWHARRRELSSTVNVLSFALYSLFAANTKYPELAPMREACFAYFQLGGECANGPMNLLSVMKANPLILMIHFFSVAMYGIYRTLFPIPTPGRLWAAFKIFKAACEVFMPLCLGEHLLSLRYPAC